MRPRPRPYPLGPLLARTGVSQGTLGHLVNAGGSAVKKAAKEGCTEVEADRWACRLGVMPHEIWADWPEFQYQEGAA